MAESNWGYNGDMYCEDCQGHRVSNAPIPNPEGE
jgi:hypothetical protein